MSVYLFTFHAYRSWNADDPRGFVQQGRGLQDAYTKLANFYDQAAVQTATLFQAVHQQVLIWIAHDACTRREWRLHFVATEPTHVHLLVSWKTIERWQDVSRKLKNLASVTLGRKLGEPGRRWFSRKASRKRVLDREHFEHLLTKYLPRHTGLQWKEGDPPPEEPPAIGKQPLRS